MRTVLALFALLLATGPGHAVDEASRSSIRGVIERQIEAFRRDDGIEAYAQAAPLIQRLFPSEERFMRMVREGYKPVYRPKAYSFGEAKDTDDGPVQSVRITDEDGEEWLAVYSLERQADGQWKISGCTLVKVPTQAA